MKTKARLVKASAYGAKHNREQAQRIDDDAQSHNNGHRRRKRKARRFNPLIKIPSNEEKLQALRDKLDKVEADLLASTNGHKAGLKAQAMACRKAINSLELRIARYTPRELREEVQADIHAETVDKVTKAKSKVPKTNGHGLRGKPEPYTGPGKPTNNISVGRKPTLVRAEPPAPVDKTKFNKPQRPVGPKDSSHKGYIWELPGYERKKKR